MLIASFDPGKTTGWAVMTPDSPLIVGEAVWRHNFIESLDQIIGLKAEAWIIEDYKVRPAKSAGFNHSWSSVLPAQVIGALVVAADRAGVEVVMQQPSIKPIGYQYLGIPYVKGKKGQHINDALAHGQYYFRKNNVGAEGS